MRPWKGLPILDSRTCDSPLRADVQISKTPEQSQVQIHWYLLRTHANIAI